MILEWFLVIVNRLIDAINRYLSIGQYLDSEPAIILHLMDEVVAFWHFAP